MSESKAIETDDASACERPSSTRRKRRFAVTKYVPVLEWLPRYTRIKAISDLIAGVTLGLTMIPQSIAYAALAGLTAQVSAARFTVRSSCAVFLRANSKTNGYECIFECATLPDKELLQYGLYSCFVGGFLYVIFGTIKEVSIGPSSLMALLTLQFTRDMPVDFVVLLCFLVGCVEFLMGILHLGLYLLREIIYDRLKLWSFSRCIVFVLFFCLFFFSFKLINVPMCRLFSQVS